MNNSTVMVNKSAKSTNRTITSHINIKKTTTLWRWKSRSWLGSGTKQMWIL